MVEVYYYMPVEEIANAVECGIKLSKWFDKEVELGGSMKKCLSALLNPKDDLVKYNSQNFKCLKLELDCNYCYVADKYLYDVGLNYPQVMEQYFESIKPINDYIFGLYRIPECLITSTAIGGQIKLLDKRLDSPILFGDSEELYLNNIIEKYKEENENFTDAMLYNFYCRLAQIRKIDKIEDMEKKIALFIDNEKQTTIAIKIPNMEKF